MKVKQVKPDFGSCLVHLKLILFEKKNGERCAILGSSNLTEGGFERNIEANVLLCGVNNPPAINKLWELYNDLWNNYSEKLDSEKYVEEVEITESSSLKNLFDFQKKAYDKIVKNYETNENTNRSTLLCLPTVAGKTLIAVMFLINPT